MSDMLDFGIDISTSLPEYFHFKTGEKGIMFEKYFDNGYRTTVICHSESMGGNQGLWELGLWRISNQRNIDESPKYNMASISGIAEDAHDTTIGYLTEEEVTELLDKVSQLSHFSINQDGPENSFSRNAQGFGES